MSKADWMSNRWVRWAMVVAGLAAGTIIVYVTGGTQFVWPHLMYFSVVFAGVAFGRRAGLAVGIVAGLLMGPLMPLDVAADVSQPVRGWLVRMAFYVGIGVLAGYSRYRFDALLDRRSRFLSAVGHELRTPLSAVVGFADILHGEWARSSEAEKRELATHILREGTQVAHVVDDLLVAGRIDSGRLNIQTETVDLRRLADSVVEGLGPCGAAGRVSVEGGGEAHADAVRVRQIVRNLLRNAAVDGGERIEVELSSRGDKALVVVRHEGSGTSEAALPRLLEPYLTEDVEHSLPQSVGLGLAVARELAARMGGSLTHHADARHSSFVLELPSMPRCSDSPAYPPHADSPNGTGRFADRVRSGQRQR